MKNKVLLGGCFDILHYGHIYFLKKARSYGDFLVVLLESDENIKKLKGSDRPIHNFFQRKETLLSLKFVDRVIKVPSSPTYKTYERLVKKIKPSVIAITAGDPLKSEKAKQAKSIGAKIRTIKMFKSYSSTMIKKIIEQS